MTPRVSVIIPTRSKASYLDLTLAGLAQQNLSEVSQVIIVSFGEDGETSLVCQKYSHVLPLEHVTTDTPGRSFARNVGIERATGERLLFLDDDSIPQPGLVDAHIAMSSTSPATAVMGQSAFVLTHAEVSVSDLRSPDAEHGLEVGQSLSRLDGETTIVRVLSSSDVHGGPSALSDLSHRLGDLELLREFHDGCNAGLYPAPWIGFATLHASAPRDLVVQVGGFDDSLRGWGEEDPELGYRLHRAGCRFRVLLEPIVFNQIHGPSRVTLGAEWVANYLRLAQKHADPAWLLRWQHVLGLVSTAQYQELVQDARGSGSNGTIRQQFELFRKLVEVERGREGSLTMQSLRAIGDVTVRMTQSDR